MAGITITGVPSSIPGNEVSPPPLTGDVLLDTYNTLMNQRLAVLQHGPAVTYRLHSHEVDWTTYMEYLDSAILAVMVQMAQVEPVEQVGLGI